ncbi:MAG: recombinase family protein [Lactobacillales bacterium]|jgi:DNA invertase Pin-like site-specific DNA recombinase|nr:recombinase family protein [Lactobacillales bacterium]
MAKRVVKIPAARKAEARLSSGEIKKRRVAGYARVSTDKDEQFSSYEAQVDYYTTFIKGRGDWEFVEVYTDEGITGTSTKRREGFKRMVADALSGKIDLIVTKSVSRFARNTVDSLTTVRQLKGKGVEIYFEKENIWTLDSKGELLITIMSSLAQEESRSISENCAWGKRKSFADGKVNMPYAHFLGYDKGDDGNPVINEKQAKIVRRIYGLFLKGQSTVAIANQLTAEGIPTPGGKTNWTTTVISSILSNEKYKGDALLQKSFTTDFLTKKMKRNEGELPQYYITKNHDAIIDPKVFDLVQNQIALRATEEQRRNCVHALSSRIKCGDCGSWYGSKVWHSNSKYKRRIWQCNKKYSRGKKCSTPHLDDDFVKEKFIKAVNQLIGDKSNMIDNFNEVKELLFSTEELSKQSVELSNEVDILDSLINESINDNARRPINQSEYEVKYNNLILRLEAAEKQLTAVEAEITLRKGRREQIEIFLSDLSKLNLITEFDEEVWAVLIDFVEVITKDELIFNFKDGTKITV